MKSTIIRHGVVAGVLGATAVAAWFLIMDVIFRQAFFTPLGLGQGLMALFAPGRVYAPAVVVISYTVFHYAAFVGVGLLASVIVHLGEREPTVLAGAFILFIAIELGFYGISSMLASSPVFKALGWYEVAAGNVVAAVVMGSFLWRTHPGLKRGLEVALGDESA